MNGMKRFHLWIKVAVLFGVIGFLCAPAFGADYPSRNVTVVVPYSPGGGVDINTRTLAPHLSKYLGQKVIVENRTGAGGITGHTLGAFAKPDGYTLTMASTGIAAAPWVVKGVKFTPNDYAYIGQVSFVPNFLLVNAKSPWKNLKELIDYAKKNPGKVSTGTQNGWPSKRIADFVFRAIVGVDVRVITGYKGGAPYLADLLGGHLDYTFNDTNEILPHYLAKPSPIRVLAAAALNRTPFCPDIPTFREQGFDVTLGVWRTLAAPAGTPEKIIDTVNAALQKALKDPALAEDFKKVGLTVDYLSPEEATKFVLAQYQQLGQLFKKAGIAVK